MSFQTIIVDQAYQQLCAVVDKWHLNFTPDLEMFAIEGLVGEDVDQGIMRGRFEIHGNREIEVELSFWGLLVNVLEFTDEYRQEGTAYNVDEKWDF